MIALMGTPSPFSTWESSTGLLRIGVANREFGCAAFSLDPGVHLFPRQSIACFGGGPSFPSHQTSPSSVSATFVYRVSRSIDFIAFGFDLWLVPGTTPK